jgi:hypothetical protein
LLPGKKGISQTACFNEREGLEKTNEHSRQRSISFQLYCCQARRASAKQRVSMNVKALRKQMSIHVSLAHPKNCWDPKTRQEQAGTKRSKNNQ